MKIGFIGLGIMGSRMAAKAASCTRFFNRFRIETASDVLKSMISQS